MILRKKKKREKLKRGEIFYSLFQVIVGERDGVFCAMRLLLFKCWRARVEENSEND